MRRIHLRDRWCKGGRQSKLGTVIGSTRAHLRPTQLKIHRCQSCATVLEPNLNTFYHPFHYIVEVMVLEVGNPKEWRLWSDWSMLVMVFG